MEYHLRKIGLLGGTFDPIHLGHLNLAIEIREKHALDAVIFCPAALSPFKGGADPKAPPADRLKMVQLAIEGIEDFSVLDFEINRAAPSYTIDTVRHLIAQEGSPTQFYLILGQDGLAHFSKWKEAGELKRLCPLLIGCRPGSCSPGEGVTEIASMDISSTLIRGRLAQKKTCIHLLPAKVLDYISENQLYL